MSEDMHCEHLDLHHDNKQDVIKNADAVGDVFISPEGEIRPNVRRTARQAVISKNKRKRPDTIEASRSAEEQDGDNKSTSGDHVLKIYIDLPLEKKNRMSAPVTNDEMELECQENENRGDCNDERGEDSALPILKRQSHASPKHSSSPPTLPRAIPSPSPTVRAILTESTSIIPPPSVSPPTSTSPTITQQTPDSTPPPPSQTKSAHPHPAPCSSQRQGSVINGKKGKALFDILRSMKLSPDQSLYFCQTTGEWNLRKLIEDIHTTQAERGEPELLGVCKDDIYWHSGDDLSSEEELEDDEELEKTVHAIKEERESWTECRQALKNLREAKEKAKPLKGLPLSSPDYSERCPDCRKRFTCPAEFFDHVLKDHKLSDVDQRTRGQRQRVSDLSIKFVRRYKERSQDIINEIANDVADPTEIFRKKILNCYDRLIEPMVRYRNIDLRHVTAFGHELNEAGSLQVQFPDEIVGGFDLSDFKK